jgi:hypothetical protein
MPTAYAEGIGDFGDADVTGTATATLYADPISRILRSEILRNPNIAAQCGARVWVYSSEDVSIVPNVVIYRVDRPLLAPIRAGGPRYQVSVRVPSGRVTLAEVIAASIVNTLQGFTTKRGTIEINSIRYIDQHVYTEETTKNERADIDFQVFYVMRE